MYGLRTGRKNIFQNTCNDKVSGFMQHKSQNNVFIVQFQTFTPLSLSLWYLINFETEKEASGS